MKNMKEQELEKLLVEYTEGLSEENKSEDIELLSEELDSDSSLFETVQLLSSTIKPKKPSEEFAARLSQAAQQKFQEQMAAEKIRRIIGMVVTDGEFRQSFFHDMITACRDAGFDLTKREIAALRNLKEDAVEKFANSLDERITKFFPAGLP